jgi:hypothetical protein
VFNSLSNINTNIPPTIKTVSVDPGVRSLAVDLKDKLLFGACQGSGRIALIDLNKNEVIDWVDAVRGENETKAQNDHSDRLAALNNPTIQWLSPTTGTASSSFVITVTGTNLTGATDVYFVDPSTVFPHGPWEDGEYGNGVRDAHFKATDIQATSDGKKLTASITVSSGITTNRRFVLRIETPNGNTGVAATPVNVLQVN